MPNYFLDTSALAKLYHQEAGSERMQALAQDLGARLIISELSLIELESVFATKVRTGAVANIALDQLRGSFNSDIARGRLEVVLLARRHFGRAGDLVRQYAVNHALRTLDAVQLSVALDLRSRGVAEKLVASDRRLCEVATLAGMPILNPSETAWV